MGRSVLEAAGNACRARRAIPLVIVVPSVSSFPADRRRTATDTTGNLMGRCTVVIK